MFGATLGWAQALGYLGYLCLVILLGALVAYAAKRERQRSKKDGDSPEDKPSFLRELRDRLKDPYKPTDY
jgi:hypothetical protein